MEFVVFSHERKRGPGQLLDQFFSFSDIWQSKRGRRFHMGTEVLFMWCGLFQI